MKIVKRSIILFIVVAFAACTDNYNTAKTLLDGIENHNKSFDSIKTLPKFQEAFRQALIDQISGIQIKTGIDPDIIIDPKYIEQLKKKGYAIRAEALQEMNTHIIAIIACKNSFLKVIDNVTDKEKRMELLSRYDRVYQIAKEK